MNASTVEAPRAPLLGRTVLNKDGITCTLFALPPGHEIACTSEQLPHEQVLYVVDGRVRVQVGELHYILERDEALHIAAGQEHAITGSEAAWSKVLRVEIVPRQVFTTPLYTFARS